MTSPCALDMPLVWALARGTVRDADPLRAALAGRVRAALDQGARVEDLVAEFAGHGLVPLAYRHLISGGRTDLPDTVASGIAREFRAHALTRLRYARLLRDLLDALEAAGIEARPYKGPVLAIQLYGNYAMRQYGDLDILVRPSQAEAALRTLVAQGLVRHRAKSPEWEDYFRRTRHSAELRDPRVDVLVELHWAVADRLQGVDLDVDWLMEASRRVDLLGRPTQAIDGARLLLALCAHGAKHLWERAIWLAEIAELLAAQPDLDWRLAFGQADRTDLGRSLRASLILVRDHFGIEPPAPWSRELHADLAARRLASALDARLTDTAPPARLADMLRLGLLARSTLWRRVRFAWRTATDLSERDARTLAAPPDSPIAYGVTRTLRLINTARVERSRRI